MIGQQKDYYDVLGVSKSATKAEIDKAYKKLLIQYHPDKNKSPGADAKYKEVSEAYSVLGNPDKRKAYDTGGPQFSNGGYGFNNSGGYGDYDFMDDSDVISQIFDMFGMGGQRQSKGRSATVRGEDISQTINLTLEQVFAGCTINFDYDKYFACESCKGSGFSGSPKECTSCKGSGFVTSSMGGIGYMRSPCPQCGGQGSRYSETSRCDTCHGGRRHKKRVSYAIQIPWGVSDGEALQVPGKGHEGINSPSGSLIIHVKVKKNSKFERQNFDLYTSVEVPISIMVLGGEKEILDIGNEKIILNIPKGSTTEKRIAIHGRGMRYAGSNSRGALYVRLIPVLPQYLAGEELSLWQKIYEIENNKPPKRSNWW